MIGQTWRGAAGRGCGRCLAQGVLGLYLALWLDVPPGPAISVLGAGAYASCALGLAAAARGPRARPAGAKA